MARKKAYGRTGEERPRETVRKVWLWEEGRLRRMCGIRKEDQGNQYQVPEQHPCPDGKSHEPQPSRSSKDSGEGEETPQPKRSRNLPSLIT